MGTGEMLWAPWTLLAGIGRLRGQRRACPAPLRRTRRPQSPSPAGKGRPPLGAPAPSREAALSPQGAWVGSAGRPAASTRTLLLPSILALQPGAGGRDQLQAGGPEQTSRWEDPAPWGDPAALDGPCPFRIPPTCVEDPSDGSGPWCVRQSRAAPQGQPGGSRSQILTSHTPQSGASSGPSPGPPPVGLLLALTSPPQRCPRAPEPLSQHPFQALQVLPYPPHPHLVFSPANPGEAHDSSSCSAPSRRFPPLHLWNPYL